MMAAGAVDVVQPSVTKVGGVSGMLAVQDLAARHGVAVVPHSPYFGPGLLATLHVLAAAEVEEPLEVYFADLDAPPYPGAGAAGRLRRGAGRPRPRAGTRPGAARLSRLRRGPSLPALAAGLLAGFVGFASSFAVVLQGLQAMGASPAQAASGLMALSIAMGLCGMLLSAWRRMPISVAWSTPGAALLAASATPAGGFPVAVGAFLLCGLLLVAAGLWKPLGRAVAAIPAALANAMLAGVLLGLCLAPLRAVAEAPALGRRSSWPGRWSGGSTGCWRCRRRCWWPAG